MHPVDNDLANILADGEEPGRERLRELGAHFARILHDLAFDDVDVLAFEGGDGAVAAPVSRVKATTARLRSSISVVAGMVCSTCRIWSMVGTGRSAMALAILASLSDNAKYSASAEVRCDR